ncbi:hypothetical protein DVH24_029480 [Malus domestica]|uniref:Uncharacterized protein n=1 Tax=Malus domestica TaxID=3750 RepID=A0A498HVS3_MALDO|nr:hypothetical protein DVH24_029480 [Malus domestica]
MNLLLPYSDTRFIGVADASAVGLRNDLELVKSPSEKHLERLRPSARYYSIFKGRILQVRDIMVMVGQAKDAADPEKGKYSLIRDAEDFPSGIYEKQLPCFGCGFVFPLMWYYATVLYFGNYYRKDPRERAGLAASAIAVYLSLSFDYIINWHNYPIVAGTSLCCRAVDHSIVSDVLDLLNRKRASNIFTSMKKSMTGVEQIANQSHSKGINLVDCRGELELNQSVSVLHSPQLSSPVA